MAILRYDKKNVIGADELTIKGFIKPSELEKAVYKKLKNIGINKEDYPINPYELIEREGIILQEMSLDNENIRGMLVHGPNVSGIVINANRSYVSRRFIAMHELIHYWFHPRNTKRVCFEEYKHLTKGIEWQANNAAAYALMPKEIVAELYDFYDGDVMLMADWLQVSSQSLRYRLNELGIQPTNKSFIEYQAANQYYTDPVLLSLENSWLYSGL